MAKGRWKVGTETAAGITKYVVYRLKDKSGKDSKQNREYFGEELRGEKIIFNFERTAEVARKKLEGVMI